MTTIELGYITVPSGSLLLIDTGYLNMWSHDKPPVMPAGILSSDEATEKANTFVDLKLVGKDAEKVAFQFEAPRLSESEFGWIDMPIDEAAAHGIELEEYRDGNQLRVAGDFRPHSHHWQVLRDTRASNTNSATIEIDGARLMSFCTLWGDGKYDVYRGMDANGSLLRIRIDLATSAKPKFEKMLEKHRQPD